MATLVVENVPEDLYEALRARAQANQKSVSAEVLELLTRSVPTSEGARRRAVIDEIERLRLTPPLTSGPFPSAEQLIREDRDR